MKEWTLKDLVDQRVRTIIWERVSHFSVHFLRLFILLGILIHFFSFGICPSESMHPTIKVNDFMVFKKTTNFERGDIIFFKFPLDEKQMYLKRVIGLPGDEVEVRDGYVYVNGKALDEPYLNEKPTYTLEKQVVPKEHYFVLGDNRNHSFDSSQWGFVAKDKTKGKVLAVLLPFNRWHFLFFVHKSKILF